jgi:hypothetical protein
MEDEWDPEEFKIFYPDTPLSWETDEIVDRDSITYYRSAYAFACRLHSSYEDTTAYICKNLPSCLKCKADSLILGGSIKALSPELT